MHTSEILEYMRVKTSSTPKPWKYGKAFLVHKNLWRIELYAEEFEPVTVYGRTSEEAAANAALIVKAVNRDHLFDDLVDALKDAAVVSDCRSHTREEVQDLIVKLHADDWTEARRKANLKARAILDKVKS